MVNHDLGNIPVLDLLFRRTSLSGLEELDVKGNPEVNPDAAAGNRQRFEKGRVVLNQLVNDYSGSRSLDAVARSSLANMDLDHLSYMHMADLVMLLAGGRDERVKDALVPYADALIAVVALYLNPAGLPAGQGFHSRPEHLWINGGRCNSRISGTRVGTDRYTIGRYGGEVPDRLRALEKYEALFGQAIRRNVVDLNPQDDLVLKYGYPDAADFSLGALGAAAGIEFIADRSAGDWERQSHLRWVAGGFYRLSGKASSGYVETRLGEIAYAEPINFVQVGNVRVPERIYPYYIRGG